MTGQADPQPGGTIIPNWAVRASARTRVLTRRVIALFCWAYAVWVLLTWTRTAEQLLFGAGIAAVVAVAWRRSATWPARGGC